MHFRLPKLMQVTGVAALLFVIGSGQANSTTPQYSGAINQGVSWLQSQIQPDGSLSSENQSIATPLQVRTEASRALFSVGQPSSALSAGLGSLNSENNSEFLARLVISTVQSGGDASAQLSALASNQNGDGGFGDAAGFQSTVFDSAYALEAFNIAGQGDGAAARNAVQYLLNHQSSDGSWSDWTGTDTAYSTAVVMAALAPYRQQLTAVGAALQSAATWLASARQSGSDWGHTFINAQVLIGLADADADPAMAVDAAGDLANAQAADGSWGDDDFSTALAIRALQAVSDIPPSSQPAGAADGYVVEAGTGRAVAGATVFLASDPQHSTTTNSDGYYALPGISVGEVTLVASASGYDSTSIAADIASGPATQVNKLVLGQSGTSALVYGRITDQQNAAAIAGATVKLSGPAQYSETAASDGSFAFGAVTPGQYTLTISASGYITDSGTVSFAAGSRYQINQALLLNGTYPNDSPIDVSATVVDATSGNPIPNATVSLNSVLHGTSDANGNVSVSGVPAGTYQASVSASGFATGLYTVVLSPGSNGALGTLRLYPSGGNVAPSTLTLIGHVVSGLGGDPIAGATITRTDTGTSWTSAADGSFTISGVNTLSFPLTISASGYDSTQFTVTASGFGTVAHTFTLPTSGGSTSATTIQLSGTVTDASSGSAIPNATVEVSGSNAQVQSDSSGNYLISNIKSLSFTLQVSAVGYVTQTIPITVSQFGNYNLNLKLNSASSPSNLQVLSVSATTAPSPSTTGVLVATIGNSGTNDVSTTLLAQVTNSKGEVVATLGGKVPGTDNMPSTFTVPASGHTSVEFDWASKQSPAGSYTVTVLAIKPGSATHQKPLGIVLATGRTWVTVSPTQLMTGKLVFNPPLVQAGTQDPVAISALIVNAGNVELPTQTLHVSVTNPANGNVIYTTTGQLSDLPVNKNEMVTFGNWVPTATGNLKVAITDTPGIDGTLYVGNKATGKFTVDRNIVAPGDETVNATIAMQGVDVTQGSSTDPLFYAVQRAVKNGADYVEPNAEQWQNQHHCLGCHIQSQSLTGLATSLKKVPINIAAVKYLATAVASAQKSDGDYRLAYPQYSLTQTILNLWAISQYPDQGKLFGNKLKAAMYLHGRRSVSGDRVYWYPDYWGGWWASQAKLTALTVKGMVDVIQSSKTANVANVVTQSWADLPSGGNVITGRGIRVGKGGRVYSLQQNGTIDWIDPAAGTTGSIPVSGLPGNAYGLALSSDGSFYVSGTGFVAHIVSGQNPVYLWRGNGTVSSVDMSPKGDLYGVNTDNSQLICYCNGTATVVLDSQTLNQPSDLMFDSSGNLMIADRGNYDLVEVKADGTEIKWAQGLGQGPERITSDGQGGWYVRSTTGYPLGYYDAPQIYHFTSDGVGQRIAGANNLSGIALYDGKLIANNASSNKVVELVSQPVDVNTDISSLRQDVVGAAHYFLATYKDGSTNIITQALRIWGMGEARKVVTDSTLKDQLDQAITYLDQKLRSEQRSDGGWGRYPGYTSDALVTAVVGLALDYSHPSPSDKVTRAAIQFLLNAQQGDGSWLSADTVMHTRLSTTSLVMDYMPEALSFLGGLDVDLYVSDTPKAHFSDQVPAQNDTSIDGQGISTYHWHLTGVTSSGQNVAFKVGLPAMLANEERSVASSAYLQFKNSFDSSTMKVDLSIPKVKAVSGLGITVGTDLSRYGAYVPVKITGIVGNSGVPTQNAKVQVQIYAPDGTLITTQQAASGLQIATGGQSAYSTSWNTGNYLPGTYSVKASVIDDTGTAADTATTPLSIVASASGGGSGGKTASLRTTTDRSIYNITDTVNIGDLVRNLTANADLSLAHLHVTVTDPSGAIVHIFDHDLGQLAAGAQRNVTDALALNQADQGDYVVAADLTDATGASLATGEAHFTVSAQINRLLSGQVAVQSPSVYQGKTEVCADTLRNSGVQAMTGEPIKQLLVDITDGSVIESASSNVDVGAGQQTQLVRNVETGPLAVGNYACVLQARENNIWKSLGYANFHVAPPPIKLSITQNQLSASRILVYISCHEDHGEHQTHHRGRDRGNNCETQRSDAIDGLLNALHVNHHVSVTADDFVTRMRSGDYNQYWILGGLSDFRGRLSEELEEAVYRGDTLLVDGELHGWQNSELFGMAGVKVRGKLPASAQPTVDLQAPMFNSASLGLQGRALRLRLETGTVDAVFGGVSNGGGNHEGHQGNDDDGGGNGNSVMPAIVDASYGKGRVIAIGFDLAGTLEESSLSSQWADPLNKVITYLLPGIQSVILPHAYLPITTQVENQGIAVTLNVTDLLPSGATFVDAAPAAETSSKGSVVWLAPLAVSQSKAFTAGISVPANPGSYGLTSKVSTITNGGQPALYGSVSYPFDVADPQVLSQSVSSEIAALDVHGDDRHERDQAIHELGEASNEASRQHYDEAIGELLDAAEDLERIDDVDVTQAREDLDTLISAYELDWYWSGDRDYSHSVRPRKTNSVSAG